MNSMRDRLIKILCGVKCEGGEEIGNCPQRRDGQCRTVQKLEMCQIGAITDHLLANGVIVPPCKVGDTVYYIGGIRRNLIKSATVEEIIMNSNGVSDLLVISENVVTFENSVDIFYFTREEAEQALLKP